MKGQPPSINKGQQPPVTEDQSAKKKGPDRPLPAPPGKKLSPVVASEIKRVEPIARKSTSTPPLDTNTPSSSSVASSVKSQSQSSVSDSDDALMKKGLSRASSKDTKSSSSSPSTETNNKSSAEPIDRRKTPSPDPNNTASASSAATNSSKRSSETSTPPSGNGGWTIFNWKKDNKDKNKDNKDKDKPRPQRKHSRSQSFDSATSRKEKKKSDKTNKRHTAPTSTSMENTSTSPSLFSRLFSSKPSPKISPVNTTKDSVSSPAEISDYAFTSENLSLLSKFIISTFGNLQTRGGSGLSKVSKTFKDLNEGNIEFSPTIELVSETQLIAKKEKWVAEIKREKKNILFLLNKNNDEITAYVADPTQPNILEEKIEANSAFGKILHPIFTAGNTQRIDKQLQNLLLKQALYRGHIPVLETVAEHYQVLANCKYLRFTLSKTANDNLIGVCAENSQLIGHLLDIEDNLTQKTAEFIKAYQKDIKEYVNKYLRVSITKSYTTETESFASLKAKWQSSMAQPGNILLVYDQNNQSWIICYCKKEGTILEKSIDKTIFNHFNEIKETDKSTSNEEESGENDSERSSESEKMGADLGPEDMTDKRTRQLLTLIKLNQLFDAPQEEEKSQGIHVKKYAEIPGRVACPKPHEMFMTFATDYFTILTDRCKQNAARPAGKPTIFGQPPEWYDNKNGSEKHRTSKSTDRSPPSADHSPLDRSRTSLGGSNS